MPRIFLVLATLCITGLLAAGCAPVLAAPPHLVAAWPAAGATLPIEQAKLDLTFNQTLNPESSWAALSRDEDGAPQVVESAVEAGNARRLSIVLKEPSRGEYRLHWHAVAARTAAAVDGEQYFSMRDESSMPPRVEVSRVVADSGEILQVTGEGFGKRCPTRLTIGDDEQPLSTIKTDSKGSFTTEVPVPRAVPFGEQPVSATDACGSVATTAVQVRWGGWPPLVAQDVGAAGPGAGEVTFWVTLRNRSDYVLEHLRVVVDDPPNGVMVAVDPPPGRQGGSMVWEIPVMHRGVLGPYRVTYRVTGPVASHAWIEYRHRRPYGCSGDECLPAFISDSVSESTPLIDPAANQGFAHRL